MMTINALRCPRNAGAVANNKRVHASSDRCSSSNSTRDTNTNSRRRKGVVLSSFGKAWKSLFISLFFFFLVLSRRSRERKKRLNSLLSCVLLLLLLREEDLVLFRARAQTTSMSTALRYLHRPRSRIDLRGVLRARKERDLLSQERERERENKTTAEGRGEKVFLLSFLSFSFCFLQNQSKKTGVEDPSCGSESVAVKKGGHKRKREFFFCSDIHSFSLLSYLQKQGITTRTIKGRYTRTL